MATSYESISENAGRKQIKGRFQPGKSGNPFGKPKGTRHKATLAAQSLIDGEANALTRKAVELALIGDSMALRLCLERLLPPRRDAPVQFDMPPMIQASDVVKVQAAILQAVANGSLTPYEAGNVAKIADSVRYSIETVELERRISELEQAGKTIP